MSKTDASLDPLVGILRFNFPTKSTRTLSATQAYDTSRSQVVLGSFTGKLTDKTATEKSPDYAGWTGSLTTYRAGGRIDDAGAKRNNARTSGAETVSLSATSSAPIILTSSSSLQVPVSYGITFNGTTTIGPANGDQRGSSNSKATNANTTYYGAITVGLGEYKKWQGNYAVLKINTVTEKAVLRIYAD